MPTEREAIKREVDRKALAIEGQQIVDLLPLDDRKIDKMYFKGPPTMVYCKLPNGASMRIAITDTGILSNEVQHNPEKFRVRVAGPYYKLPADPEKVVAYGELVRLKDIHTSTKDMGATVSSPLLGHKESSQIVKSLEMEDGTALKIGDKGDIQLVSKGQVIKTFTENVEVSRKPENSTVMFGGDKRVLFKNNFLGEILPKAFIPPMNSPNWTVDSSIFKQAVELLDAAIDIAIALKKAER